MKIDAVLLDMDGLLFDSEQIYYDTWKMAEKKFGFTNSEVAFAQLTGSQPADPLAVYIDFLGDEALARQVYDYRMKEAARLRKERPVPPKPGARELLDDLCRRQVPRALATSSGLDWARHLFATNGMALDFTAIVTKEKITHSKPHPEIFLKAAEELGVPIERCLVVEDSGNGVRAAAAAGAHIVMVPDLLPPNDALRALADAVLPSLVEVRQLLVAQGV